jgi:hypothetical protein
MTLSRIGCRDYHRRVFETSAFVLVVIHKSILAFLSKSTQKARRSHDVYSKV